MPASPSTKNYTLGKGKLYFDKLDASTGLPMGERDLGNAPSIAFNVTLEALEHFSSRSGLKAKDKKQISQVTPQFNFQLDEISADNLAMFVMSDSEDVNQAAATGQEKALTSVEPNMSYDLEKRATGIHALGFDGGTGVFTVGDTLTGTESSATAVIVQVLGTTAVGTLYLKTISGTFEDDEALTDATTGAAVANGIVAFLDTAVSIEDTDDAGTYFVAGTDFVVDSMSGHIRITPESDIDGTTVTNITVTFSIEAVAYKLIKGLAQTEINGRLRFVSDNAAGNQMEMEIWTVSLMPSGDMAMIGDDWAVIGFDGEILKDEENHPTNPYFSMIVVPAL